MDPLASSVSIIQRKQVVFNRKKKAEEKSMSFEQGITVLRRDFGEGDVMKYVYGEKRRRF